MRDLRLYTYDSGSLIKCGRGKTGMHKHFYNSVEDIEAYVDRLKSSNRNIGYQYIVVEYFSTYHSRIIKIIEDDTTNK
jgi:hypothetical protein